MKRIGILFACLGILLPVAGFAQTMIWEIPVFVEGATIAQGEFDNDAELEVIQWKGGVGFAIYDFGIDMPVIEYLDTDLATVSAGGDFDGDGSRELIVKRYTYPGHIGDGVYLMDVATELFDYSFVPESDDYSYSVSSLIGESALVDMTGDGYPELRIKKYQYSLDDFLWTRYYSFTTETAVGSSNVTTVSWMSVEPNPSTGGPTIRFSLPSTGAVRLGLYDAAGRLVQSVIDDGHYDAGRHAIPMRGENVSTGVYFLRLTSGDVTRSQKVVVIR